MRCYSQKPHFLFFDTSSCLFRAHTNDTPSLRLPKTINPLNTLCLSTTQLHPFNNTLYYQFTHFNTSPYHLLTRHASLYRQFIHRKQISQTDRSCIFERCPTTLYNSHIHPTNSTHTRCWPFRMTWSSRLRRHNAPYYYCLHRRRRIFYQSQRHNMYLIQTHSNIPVNFHKTIFYLF